MITNTEDWVTLMSADSISTTFGIDISEIESRIIVSVCNADKSASSGWYSWAVSNDSGVEARCSTSSGTRCRYTIACV